jgi:hypothetical protein
MKLNLLLFQFCLSIIGISQTALVTSGNQWKYYDQGNNLPTNWNSLAYNDGAWSTGNTEMGYGDGDENTGVGFGLNNNNKYITTYFRKTIVVTNPSQFSHLDLSVLRDDGAVVYINGIEVWRSNMPNGPITFNTLANGAIAWPFEDDWHNAQISASNLVNGNNVIAVEIHQDDVSSSDISFNLSLIAQSALNAVVTRGPYLQKANQNSVIIRWRTDIATDSRVDVGVSPILMNNTTTNQNFTTDHEVLVSGLNPNTSYFYGVGHFSQLLASGNNMYFETLPNEGESGDYEFLVLGDCGTGYQEQIDVRNAVIGAYGNHFDGMLLLGDNAYQSGFDSEYQSNFFEKYTEFTNNTVIWPAPGNHDYNNHIPFSPDPAYYDAFNLPTNGESGGVPSGTEKYYSYNFGNIHFISLDSYDVPRSASAAMATWLNQDLAANNEKWVVAYWHHPPYTKGSHDSDNDNFLDGELVEMREEIVPILEAYGVDLILNGHSHSYERSMLIDGHYGNSNSFNANHQVDNSTGNYPAVDCPYHKDSNAPSTHNGTVYCVMGNSGKTSGIDSEWPHPVMVSYTNTEVGALIINVKNNRLDATFCTGTGAIYDHFTIVKSPKTEQVLNVCIGDVVNLNPTWETDQTPIWHPGNLTQENYQITALANATVVRSDAMGCLPDTFNIVVHQNDTCGYLSFFNNEIEETAFNAYYANGYLVVENYSGEFNNFELYNINGQVVSTFQTNTGIFKQDIQYLPQGSYFLKPQYILKSKRINKND